MDYCIIKKHNFGRYISKVKNAYELKIQNSISLEVIVIC